MNFHLTFDLFNEICNKCLNHRIKTPGDAVQKYYTTVYRQLEILARGDLQLEEVTFGGSVSWGKCQGVSAVGDFSSRRSAVGGSYIWGKCQLREVPGCIGSWRILARGGMQLGDVSVEAIARVFRKLGDFTPRLYAVEGSAILGKCKFGEVWVLQLPVHRIRHLK